VTFNTVDKLQFVSFILAVLLPIKVHLIALRLGRATMHQHTKILIKSVQMVMILLILPMTMATMLNF